MSSRRQRRRRRTRAVVGAVVAVVLVLGAWAAIDAFRVVRKLNSARASLTSVSANREGLADEATRAAGSSRLRAASRDASAAAGLVRRSVPLRLAGVLPIGAAQRDGVRRLAEDVADAAASAARTLDVAGEVAGVASGDGRALVPVDRTPALQAAAAETARTLRRTTRGSASLLGPVNDARDRYDEVAEENAETLQDAADALAVVRPFSGGDGVRRYLVLGQNNAEMRDSGMVLSYAVVRAEAGRFRVERRGSVDDLRLVRATAIEPPGSGTAQLFSSLEPTRLWQSVNATADWPWTCEAALAMYAQATGERLDGVLALDVVGLGEVLGVTGPVSTEGVPRPVSKDNAADLLLRELYDRLPPGSDQGPRRDAVAGVASAVVDALSARPPDRVRLALALGRAAAGGHLRVYSSRAEEQAVFARLGPGDGPDGPTEETAARTFHVAVQNGNGTKLDYHLRTKVVFDVTTTAAGNAVVRTTVVATNGAPVGAAPSYALGPNLGLTHAPGRYDGRVYLWGPRGAGQQDSLEDAGLRASQTVVGVDAGGRAEVRFETVLRGAVRDGRVALRLVPQARLRPSALEVRIDGQKVHSGSWRTIVDDSWEVHAMQA